MRDCQGLLLKCVIGASAWIVSTLAHAGSAVTVSWTTGQTTTTTTAATNGAIAVPSMSAHAAALLAFLVALILWRALLKHRGTVASTVLTLFLGASVVGMAWVSDVWSGGPITYTPGGGLQCNDSATISDNTNKMVELNNQCNEAVTVTYDVSQSICATVQELACRDGGDGCVEDGGEVAAGETRSLRDCVTS